MISEYKIYTSYEPDEEATSSGHEYCQLAHNPLDAVIAAIQNKNITDDMKRTHAKLAFEITAFDDELAASAYRTENADAYLREWEVHLYLDEQDIFFSMLSL